MRGAFLILAAAKQARFVFRCEPGTQHFSPLIREIWGKSCKGQELVGVEDVAACQRTGNCNGLSAHASGNKRLYTPAQYAHVPRNLGFECQRCCKFSW
jgi:hypothetical protein